LHFFRSITKTDLRCAAKTDAGEIQSNPVRRATTNSAAKKESDQEFDAISSIARERERGLPAGCAFDPRHQLPIQFNNYPQGAAREALIGRRFERLKS
jgi:hypothetical protein